MVVSKEGMLVKEKQWDGNVANYPLQTSISHIDAFNPDARDEENALDIFSPGSAVFVLAPPYYGSKATVISSELGRADSTVTVEVEIVSEPDLVPIITTQELYVSDDYMPGYVAAQQLGLESHFVSHLFGTILVQTSPRGSGRPNRVNVGLNLKFNRKNEEVMGFTKKVENTWLYSKKAVALLNDYLSQFPDFFVRLLPHVKKDTIYLEDLCRDNSEGNELIDQIVKWLKTQESASAERQKCGAKRLDPAVVKQIEKHVHRNKADTYRIKKEYPPRQLFSPLMCKGVTQPDPARCTFSLFDRVVNVSQSTCVPTGLRGTVIGICAAESNDPSDVMYEIVFDSEFFGGLTLTCSPGRGYRLPAHSLVNITHQQRAIKSPAKTANIANRTNFNKTSANEAILKYLQSDNLISASVHNLQQSKQQAPRMVSPGFGKPFYNVNEMFQTTPSPEVLLSPENRAFSSSLEASDKQFVTPKAGYVASSYPGKALRKKDDPSPSRAHYQEFWSGLKKGGGNNQTELSPQQYGQKVNNQTESFPQARVEQQQQPTYGQKVSVRELFQSVENQKDKSYGHNNNNVRHPPPPQQRAHTYNNNNNNQQQQSFSDMLLKMCIKCFSQPPMYNFQNFGKTQLWIASITLPNGLRISGVPCDKKQDAGESAAEKAVATLSSVTQSSPIVNNRNELMFQNSGYPTPRFQGPANEIMVNRFAPPFPPPTMYPPPPPFDSRPLMRNPSPVHAARRIPDSFVVSNQFLLNSQQPPPSLSTQATTHPPLDSESFYIPGGGIARLKPRPSVQLVSAPAAADAHNLFVPNQVLKQAMVKSEEFPPLPSKNVATPPGGGKIDSSSANGQQKTVSKILRSSDGSSAVVQKTTSTTSTSAGMTVLSKKSNPQNSSRRRIAANFQNPLP